jgi:hypothetical protein
VLFKREFSINDTLLLWESMFCASSEEYIYYLAVAILEQHVDTLLKMTSFDEILQYINSLSMKINAVEILERAELLYLPYQDYDVDMVEEEE